MSVNHAPRRYAALDGIVYDLVETMNRCYWFYQNERISTANWNAISFGIERIRYERNFDWSITMPFPGNAVDAAYHPMNRWFAMHGVRAPMMMQPIDLTASDEEEDFDEGIEDQELVDLLDQAEQNMALDHILDVMEREETPLGFFDDIEHPSDEEPDF